MDLVFILYFCYVKNMIQNILFFASMNMVP